MDSIQQEKFQNFVVKLLKYLLPTIGIAGIVIPILFNRYDLAFLGTYLAIPMISAPFVFHYLQRSDEHKNQNFITKLPLLKILTIVFVFFWSVSTVILYFFEIRPWIFYLIISSLGIIVFLEILYCSDMKKSIIVILIQNILIFLTLNWGINLKYFLFIGRTDLLYHSFFIQNILETGHVTENFAEYQSYALWHFLSSYTTILTGYQIPVPKIMFIINGIAYAVLIVFVYLLMKNLQSDVKISLIAALLTVFNNDIILYGLSSISRSIVNVLMLVFFFVLILKISKIKTGLLIVLSISLLIYHHASMPFIIAILFMISILLFFLSTKKDTPFIKIQELTILGIITLTYWFFTEGGFIDKLTGSLIRPSTNNFFTDISFSAPLSNDILFSNSQNVPFYELFNYLQYIPLLFFILLGVLITLSNRNMPRIIVVFCLMSLLIVPFAFPGPAMLIEKLSYNLSLGRFGEYSVIFFSISAAYGIFFIQKSTQKIGRIFLIILIAGLFLFSVSNDFVASDNPLVKRPFYTFYLTQNEVDSTTILMQYSEKYIMSDYVITRYISSTHSSPSAHILEIDKNTLSPIKTNKNDLFLIRIAELSKRPIKLFSTENNVYIPNPSWYSNLDYYYDSIKIQKNLNKYSKIFDSYDVISFI